MKTVLFLFLFVSCVSCSIKNKDKNVDHVEEKTKEENTEAKRLLQGVWNDQETDSPILFVSGDTLKFIDQSDSPMAFRIHKDSLYTYGFDEFSYKIDKQSEYTFWFHSLSDRMVKLYKSENLEDSLYFDYPISQAPTPIYTEVIQKDSVVYYQDKRLRGYVYINPSSYKVNKPSYSDEGIRVDNIFYDNIIHICVYEGPTSLFARDVYKKDFQSLVTDSFYEQSVLSDMDFNGVDDEGYHFTATLGIPDSFLHNIVAITIDFNGKMKTKLKDVKSID